MKEMLSAYAAKSPTLELEDRLGSMPLEFVKGVESYYALEHFHND